MTTIYSNDAGCLQINSGAGVEIFHYNDTPHDDPVRIGVSGSDTYVGMVWFQEVLIDNAAVVSSAILHLAFPSLGAVPSIRVYGNARDTAAFPTDPSVALVEILSHGTAAHVDQAIGSTMAIEIKNVIQEIVNRPGWVSGNPLMLFVSAANGGAFAQMETAGAFGSFSEPYLVFGSSGGGSGGGPGGQVGRNAAFFLMLMEDPR